MHALLIRFQSTVPIGDLADPFRTYAEALCEVPGLVAKTWIKDGETLGGFHLFTSRAEADSYLGSEMVAGLTGTDGFSDFVVEHFDVLDELSRVTGTPADVLASA